MLLEASTSKKVDQPIELKKRGFIKQNGCVRLLKRLIILLKLILETLRREGKYSVESEGEWQIRSLYKNWQMTKKTFISERQRHFYASVAEIIEFLNSKKHLISEGQKHSDR